MRTASSWHPRHSVSSLTCDMRPSSPHTSEHKSQRRYLIRLSVLLCLITNSRDPPPAHRKKQPHTSLDTTSLCATATSLSGSLYCIIG